VDDLTRLALAAGDGDRVALTAFVRAAQPDVWRLCAHLGGFDRADDLTQETFERALRSLPAFEGRSSARTWILSIARRTCADSIRRRVRRRRLMARLGPAPEAVADHAGAIDLDTLVARLDDDRRGAFVLTQLLGLSYAAAAEVCGCPIGTIRSRVARAREDLLQELDEVAS
jgi:RNA polymerase sigma-70 factor (ECF subfamily)